LLLVLGLAGVAFALVVLFSYKSLERSSATASTGAIWNPVGYGVWRKGQLSTWVYMPYLSPGSQTTVEVGVYGGLAVAIDEVSGSFADRDFHHKGTGQRLPSTIRRKRSSSMGSAFQKFRLVVPATAQPGEVLTLRLDVRHSLAVSEGSGFKPVQATTSQAIPILIRSPGDARLARCLSVGRALLALALAFLVGRWFYRSARTDELFQADRSENFKTTLIGVLTVFCLMAWGYVGYLLFAVPILAAMGRASDFLGPVLVACWLIGPPLLMWCIPYRERPEPIVQSWKDTTEEGKPGS
jgi:hypothetical protein